MSWHCGRSSEHSSKEADEADEARETETRDHSQGRASGPDENGKDGLRLTKIGRSFGADPERFTGTSPARTTWCSPSRTADRGRNARPDEPGVLD